MICQGYWHFWGASAVSDGHSKTWHIIFMIAGNGRFSEVKSANIQLIGCIFHLKNDFVRNSGCTPFLRVYVVFLFQIIKQNPKLVYLTLASGKVGFLRDAVIIWTSAVLQKRIVAHYHGGNFHNFVSNAPIWLKRIIKFSLGLVDTLVLLGGNLRFMFRNLIPSEKIRILYNGLDTEAYKWISQSTSNDEIIILFMGHLTYPKGFWQLTKAYPRLKEKFTDIHLLFAGALPEPRFTLGEFLTGEHREDFQNRMHEITNETLDFINSAEQYNGRYLGFVSGPQKMKAFSRADIFVLPSFTEGFPMSVLEAMAAGLPVVVTPVGVLPEILEDGKNGFFVTPGDVDDLTSKLEILIKDETLRRRMGENNRKYAARNFDIQIIAKQLVHILEDTIFSE